MSYVLVIKRGFITLTYTYTLSKNISCKVLFPYHDFKVTEGSVKSEVCICYLIPHSLAQVLLGAAFLFLKQNNLHLSHRKSIMKNKKNVCTTF